VCRGKEGENGERGKREEKGQLKCCSISAKQPAFYRDRNKQGKKSERGKYVPLGGCRQYCGNYPRATHKSPRQEIHFEFVFHQGVWRQAF
jgi:hypothetical protein